ncbi:MAG: hypothetical protein ABEK59_10260 [Halobacteria archaeon]
MQAKAMNTGWGEAVRKAPGTAAKAGKAGKNFKDRIMKTSKESGVRNKLGAFKEGPDYDQPEEEQIKDHWTESSKDSYLNDQYEDPGVDEHTETADEIRFGETSLGDDVELGDNSDQYTFPEDVQNGEAGEEGYDSLQARYEQSGEYKDKGDWVDDNFHMDNYTVDKYARDNPGKIEGDEEEFTDTLKDNGIHTARDVSESDYDDIDPGEDLEHEDDGEQLKKDMPDRT